MSRQLVKPPTKLQEVTNKHQVNIWRANLAEDYDGIGQWVMITFSQGSPTNAYRARVSSGDFGGGNIIPRGFEVTVRSRRGTLEVFLGAKRSMVENERVP